MDDGQQGQSAVLTHDRGIDFVATEDCLDGGVTRQGQTVDVRKQARWVWLIAVVAVLSWWATHREALSPHAIRAAFLQYESAAVVIYFLASMLRGCFLIPGTPLVLAGILMFPAQPWLVFSISMLGMIFGATIVYFGSDKLGFAEVIEKKHSKAIETVRRKMDRHGVPIVIAWSFFPLVPTDLICYVAGVVRMNFLRFIVALVIGEAILIGAYVFFGTSLMAG